MTTPWIRAQDRKRNLAAAGSTACIYALAVAAIWAAGLLAPSSLSDRAGTIVVDLGGTEGDIGDIPLGLPGAPDRPPDAEAGAAPLPAQGTIEPPPPAPETPAAKNAIPEPPAPVKSNQPTKAAPAKAAPPKTAAAAPKAAPKTAKTIPEPNAKEPEPAGPTLEELEAQQKAARAAAVAKLSGGSAASSSSSSSASSTKKFGSGTSGAPVAGATGTGSSPGVAGGTGTATFKGVEMGNALSTTFGASQGTVGRNLYVPIYLFMPLPASVDDAVFQKIGAKETFKRIYQQSGSTWTLKSQLALPQRGDYWRMLEEAGYDPARADYKAGRKLKPVTLEFAVGPIMRGANAELVDVRLVSSSGSSEIDDAVVYGFKQSAFFNKTGSAVSGKFVHSF